MAAPGDDDLMAFLAEVNEAKPPVEGEEAGGGGEGGSPSIGAGKRPRGAWGVGSCLTWVRGL